MMHGGLQPYGREGKMNNYQVTRCEALVNNPNASSELRMIAEAVVAMASGIDDADSMAQQALERIDIVAEQIKVIEKRLDALERRTAGT
jgi:DNA repair ATPase RecN